MAAPNAAPSRVPMVAPPTVFDTAASPGDTPLWRSAHGRHASPSPWNPSNGSPGPGSTITLGPVGAVTHAPTRGTSKIRNTAVRLSTALTSLLSVNTESAGPPAPSPSSTAGSTDSSRPDSGNSTRTAGPAGRRPAAGRPPPAPGPRPPRRPRTPQAADR